MNEIQQIFDTMPSRYKSGNLDGTLHYYFSIGSGKWTVTLSPEQCTVETGKTIDAADCVIKADPKVFADLVIRGKAPGAMAVARGKFKTNSLELALKMQQLFDK
jgi:putative sterol carrier protein